MRRRDLAHQSADNRQLAHRVENALIRSTFRLVDASRQPIQAATMASPTVMPIQTDLGQKYAGGNLGLLHHHCFTSRKCLRYHSGPPSYEPKTACMVFIISPTVASALAASINAGIKIS